MHKHSTNVCDLNSLSYNLKETKKFVMSHVQSKKCCLTYNSSRNFFLPLLFFGFTYFVTLIRGSFYLRFYYTLHFIPKLYPLGSNINLCFSSGSTLFPMFLCNGQKGVIFDSSPISATKSCFYPLMSQSRSRVYDMGFGPTPTGMPPRHIGIGFPRTPPCRCDPGRQSQLTPTGCHLLLFFLVPRPRSSVLFDNRKSCEVRGGEIVVLELEFTQHTPRVN